MVYILIHLAWHFCLAIIDHWVVSYCAGFLKLLLLQNYGLATAHYTSTGAPYLLISQHAIHACSHALTDTHGTVFGSLLFVTVVKRILCPLQYGSKKGNNKKSSKSTKGNIKNAPISLRDGDTVGVKVHLCV